MVLSLILTLKLTLFSCFMLSVYSRHFAGGIPPGNVEFPLGKREKKGEEKEKEGEEPHLELIISPGCEESII